MNPMPTVLQTLQQPSNAISYYLRLTLREMYPEYSLFETEDGNFYLPPFAGAGLCKLEYREDFEQALTHT
ncbi:MAG: hypothetical protein NT023_07855 [Armatimonadetes bacterium]|nr:hypothetical protein [Armatimonadota bacterium]